MSDGRTFTDYRPNCILNNIIRTQNKAENSYEYRQYLIRNGDNLIDINNEYITKKNSCDSKPAPLPDFNTVCRYDKRCGGCYLNSKCGLGLKNEGASA